MARPSRLVPSSVVSLWAVAAMAAGASFSTVERGSASGITKTAIMAVKSEDEWHRIWAQHASVRSPMPSPPQIDFLREMVIAVFAGERTTGGVTVEVTGIELSSGITRVVYRESRPAPDSAMTQALTQPYHLVRTPRVEGPVIFERQ